MNIVFQITLLDLFTAVMYVSKVKLFYKARVQLPSTQPTSKTQKSIKNIRFKTENKCMSSEKYLNTLDRKLSRRCLVSSCEGSHSANLFCKNVC